MKSLNDYTDSDITQLLNDNGAFFAFSKSQYEENAKEGVKYVQMTSGLICPKENAQGLLIKMNEVYEKAELLYLAENGLENIIKYELAYHECYYTGDWYKAYEITKTYGATEELVQQIYRSELQKQLSDDDIDEVEDKKSKGQKL